MKSRLLYAAVLMSLAAPTALRAQSWLHSWSLCTSFWALHSCHSVSIRTDALMSGVTRTGTAISISLHNLQGQGYAADDTPSSGLYAASFFAPGVSLGDYADPSLPGVPSGGATGHLTWSGSALQFLPGLSVVQVGGRFDQGLGGCGTDPLMDGIYFYGGHTCAPHSAFTFTFGLGDIVDAGQFAAAGIVMFGVSTDWADGPNICVSAAGYNDYQTPGDPNHPLCTVLGESITQVTPEPLTVVLLGTGLLGVGVARSLRRRKGRQVDA